MDFEWSEEQLAFREKVVEFAKQELNDNTVSRDHAGEFPLDNWKKCANFGIQGMAVPLEYGGSAQDILTTTLAMEGLGYGCRDGGLALALNAQMWTVQIAIEAFGSDDQKKKYLPQFCAGQLIGAQAITELESGSDALGMKTHARRVDGGYIINGAKTMVSLAPVADVFLVLATIDPDMGAWGISAFLVEAQTAGFHRGSEWGKMGYRTAPFGDLLFEDCFVAEENRLGPEGVGLSLFNSSLEWERSCMSASQLGTMSRQLEECIEYATTRKQFGQPIGKFQSISNRVAEMKVRLETTRLLLYKVAWLKNIGRPATMEAAMVKYYLSECFTASSLDAVRIHGGYGYMSEYEIERDLRDAVGSTLYGGTSDIQRNTIAKLLGLL